MSTAQPISEQDIIWALKFLDNITEAMDRATAQPQLVPKLCGELWQASPQIFEAILFITRTEGQPIISDLGKSVVRLCKVCAKINSQKKSK